MQHLQNPLVEVKIFILVIYNSKVGGGRNVITLHKAKLSKFYRALIAKTLCPRILEAHSDDVLGIKNAGQSDFKRII